MLKKLKSIFLYDSFIFHGRSSVNAQIMEENRKFAIIWSIAHILYWTFCLVMSAMKPDYLLCRDIYAVALAVSRRFAAAGAFCCTPDSLADSVRRPRD